MAIGPKSYGPAALRLVKKDRLQMPPLHKKPPLGKTATPSMISRYNGGNIDYWLPIAPGN